MSEIDSQPPPKLKMKATCSEPFSSSWKLFRLIFAAAICFVGSVGAQPSISTQPRSQFAWGGKRVTLSVTASGTAALTYQWQKGGENLVNKTNRTLSISQALVGDSGSYRVLIGDPTGAIVSDSAELLVRMWPQPTGPIIPELTRLDSDMQSVLTSHGIPGGSLAVVKDGRLVFARGYGWADAGNDERFQPDSLGQMASLSKTITAATIMRLVDEGRLALTNKAFASLNLEAPTYPGSVMDPRLTDITVRQLLNHSGGWVASAAKNPSGALGFDACFWPELTMREMGLTVPATPTELVRWMMGKPLQANPGGQIAYSSVGFLVAARIIEAITGESFETVARRLLAEAGVTRTRLGRNTRSQRFAAEAACYLHPSITAAMAFGTDNWSEPKPLDMDFPYSYPLTTLEAAGGFVSSAIDQARFVAAIDGLPSFPDVLSTNSVNAMASGMLGWDSFLSSGGSNPVSGIWGKLGFLPGAIGKAVKWRNGIVFVYLLNSWETAADPDLYDRLTLSFGSGPWPTNDLFPVTLSHDA